MVGACGGRGSGFCAAAASLVTGRAELLSCPICCSSVPKDLTIFERQVKRTLRDGEMSLREPSGTDRRPLGTGPDSPEDEGVWGVRPSAVAEVEFLKWTDANHLRHTKFVCLRDDKDARNIVKEA